MKRDILTWVTLYVSLETTVMEEIMRTVEDAMDDENASKFFSLFYSVNHLGTRKFFNRKNSKKLNFCHFDG